MKFEHAAGKRAAPLSVSGENWPYRCQKNIMDTFSQPLFANFVSKSTARKPEKTQISSRLWTLNLKKFPEPRRERAAPRFGNIFKLRPPSGGATCPKGRNRAAKTMPTRPHTNSHQTAGWVTISSIIYPAIHMYFQ